MLTEKQYMRLLCKAEREQVLVIMATQSDALTMRQEFFAIVKENWPAFVGHYTKVGTALYFKAHERIIITVADEWQTEQRTEFKGAVFVDDDYIDSMPELARVQRKPQPLKTALKCDTTTWR